LHNLVFASGRMLEGTTEESEFLIFMLIIVGLEVDKVALLCKEDSILVILVKE
jgi:hypothetical protein